MLLGIVLTPILLISLVLFVAWPLLSRREEHLREEATSAEHAWEEKEAALFNLKDIEMDYRMGKLSSQDYALLKQEYERLAVDAFKRVESLEKGKRGRKRHS